MFLIHEVKCYLFFYYCMTKLQEFQHLYRRKRLTNDESPWLFFEGIYAFIHFVLVIFLNLSFSLIEINEIFSIVVNMQFCRMCNTEYRVLKKAQITEHSFITEQQYDSTSENLRTKIKRYIGYMYTDMNTF